MDDRVINNIGSLTQSAAEILAAGKASKEEDAVALAFKLRAKVVELYDATKTQESIDDRVRVIDLGSLTRAATAIYASDRTSKIEDAAALAFKLQSGIFADVEELREPVVGAS